MKKERLLYASPMRPRQSGVSDYSEHLVYGLKEHFDLTLLVDSRDLENKRLANDFGIKVYGFDEIDFETYDHVLYNIGNNPWFHSYIYHAFLKHPGPVILHDFVLYFLAVGYYQDQPAFYAKLYEIGGAEAVVAVKETVKTKGDPLLFSNPEEIPLNSELLRRAPLLFVHSDDSRARVLAARPQAAVHKIEMIDIGRPEASLSTDTGIDGIDPQAFVIASFGMIAPTKQNHVVCRALPALSKQSPRDICYVMVGEGNHADSYLGERILKTGFLPADRYEAVLRRADMVANLRSPSMGETSISLIHAMSAGKPCVVSDLAWFSELPDDAVIKIGTVDPEAELTAALSHYLKHPDELARIGRNAREYVRCRHSLTETAATIARALRGSRGTARRC